jgi:tRNA pseudouridine55 synthase
MEACGLLLVDKPAGLSSHDVVGRARRWLGTRSVGHAGTLDPQATGLLVLAIGEATRWLPYLLNDKVYQAGLALGQETDTEDIWGKVIRQHEGVLPEPASVLRAVEGIEHCQTQVPPMVSALKHQGQRLYDLARQGIEVERPARPISIHSIQVLSYDSQGAEFIVHCSSGTYVRSLCAETGRSLGCGGVMRSLRRLRVGAFFLEQALTVEALQEEPDLARQALLGYQKALGHLQALELDEASAAIVGHGGWIRTSQACDDGKPCALVFKNRLFALARMSQDRLQPERVFQHETA